MLPGNFFSAWWQARCRSPKSSRLSVPSSRGLESIESRSVRREIRLNLSQSGFIFKIFFNHHGFGLTIAAVLRKGRASSDQQLHQTQLRD
jgi:hypothetical protein